MNEIYKLLKENTQVNYVRTNNEGKPSNLIRWKVFNMKEINCQNKNDTSI